MKKVLVGMVIGVVLFSLGYFLGDKTWRPVAGLAEVPLPAVINAEVSDRAAKLEEARNEMVRLRSADSAPGLKPEELLQRLSNMDPSTPEFRPRKIRAIVHLLESLVECGTNSLPAIRHFLSTGYDTSYLFDEPHALAGGSVWSWRPGTELRSGLVLPPTLRISLVDVMRAIGGEGAEVSLAWMLNITEHPFEVPYLAQVLETIAPERYRELSLQAARRVLGSQTNNVTADRMTGLGVGYVYNWLASRGDTSMVAQAAQAVYGTKGRFDAEAARYLLSIDSTKASELLSQAYHSSIDSETRNQIANLMMGQAGLSAAADAVFKDWVLAKDFDSVGGSLEARPRELAIRMLAGGNFGPFTAPVPTDPAVVQRRRQLLTELSSQVTTVRLRQAIDETLQRLSPSNPRQ